MTRAASYLFFVVICASAAPSALAHEMFLKPAAYQLAPMTAGKIELVNGTFEKSDNVITRDRMKNVMIHGGGETRRPSAGRWSESGLSTILTYEAGAPGTYAIGVSTKPRMITLSAKAFADYLKHDGVADTLAEFDVDGPLKQVRERYSKHVRTIVQVGDRLTAEHETAFGYPVEIVLDTNPYAVGVGEDIRFRVLVDGAPLAGQLVYASFDRFHHHGEDGGHQRAQTMRTDERGQASFRLSDAGVWYLTLVHMEKLAADPQADYESNWATVTFEIR